MRHILSFTLLFQSLWAPVLSTQSATKGIRKWDTPVKMWERCRPDEKIDCGPGRALNCQLSFEGSLFYIPQMMCKGTYNGHQYVVSHYNWDTDTYTFRDVTDPSQSLLSWCLHHGNTDITKRDPSSEDAFVLSTQPAKNTKGGKGVITFACPADDKNCPAFKCQVSEDDPFWIHQMKCKGSTNGRQYVVIQYNWETDCYTFREVQPKSPDFVTYVYCLDQTHPTKRDLSSEDAFSDYTVTGIPITRYMGASSEDTSANVTTQDLEEAPISYPHRSSPLAKASPSTSQAR